MTTTAKGRKHSLTITKQKVMRLAINDVELALSGMDMGQFIEKWRGSSDDVKVFFPLGKLRQLARAYPRLNEIMNSEDYVI